ncbi:right-handed parallel beta-helix repeat-containing protein [Geoalkalibacter halelectricus]|nr:right-handed parallel beta-helix repeat-containing protein [Geoalkalibacter halelectricus]
MSRNRLFSLRIAAAAVLALLLLGALPAAALERLPAGETRWNGKVALKAALEVPSDGVLVIAAGTRVQVADAEARILVRGGLEIAGTQDAPVVFAAPPGWQGFELMEPARPIEIQHARFEGAEVALRVLGARLRVTHSAFRGGGHGIDLVRESEAVIEDCLFADNQVGLEAQMKSRVRVTRSLFRNHRGSAFIAGHGSGGDISDCRFEGNRQALGLKGRFEGSVAANRFVDNDTAIFCNQTQRSPRIVGNEFRGSEFALVNISFSFPQVEHNQFVGNGMAVRNDQFGSAQVRHNLFADNGTALWNNRKSNPVVENNEFRDNQRALFCDFSSYPRVRNNNFIGNGMGVELGPQQSADFEARAGSRHIALEQAQARRSQNPLLARAPTEFHDEVDVRHNWWGEDTEILRAAGAEGEVPFFRDRRQLGRVSYEGWGDETYLVDRVVFAPWLDEPVADAGPKEVP